MRTSVPGGLKASTLSTAGSASTDLGETSTSRAFYCYVRPTPMLDFRALNTSIRYARAADGVSIAYWSIGPGPPLILMPTLLSHVEFEWQTRRRYLYEHLAENHQLIPRYDGRGLGYPIATRWM